MHPAPGFELVSSDRSAVCSLLSKEGKNLEEQVETRVT